MPTLPLSSRLRLHASRYAYALAQPSGPTVSLSGAQSQTEGNSGTKTFTYTITRTSTAGAVAVNWSFAAGTTSASDFSGGILPTGGTVNMADGQATGTFTVTTAGDTDVEIDETFTVSIAAPAGYTLGSPSSAIGTILNDDSAPVNPITTVDASGWKTTMSTPADVAMSPIYATRQGFDASGASVSFAETLYTGKRVRQPYPTSTSNLTPVFTASDVAPLDYIYSTDTMVGVTNNSTVASPKPICAWAMPDALLVQNTVHWEIAAFHRDARNGRQVAAVKVRANNGTTQTAWQTVAAETISSFVEDANPLAVYQGDLDVSALAAGPFWLEAEVYPFVGAAASVMKSEDNYAANSLFRFFTRRWFRKGAVPAYAYVASTGNDTSGVASATAATAAATPCLTVAGALKKLHDLLGAASNGTLDGCRIRVVDGVTAGAVPFTGSYKQDVAAVVVERAPGSTRAQAEVTQSAAFAPDFDSHSYAINGSGVIEGRLLIYDCTWKLGAATTFTGSGSPAASLHVTFWNCTLNQNSLNSNLRSSSHISHFGVVMQNITASGNPLTVGTAAGEMRCARGVTASLANQSLGAALTLGSTLTATNGTTFVDPTQGVIIIAATKFLSPNGASPAIVIEDSGNSPTASTNLAPIALRNVLVEWTSATSNPALRISGDSDQGNTSHTVIHHVTCAGGGLYGRWNLFYDEDNTTPPGVRRTHALASLVGMLGTQFNLKGDIFLAITNASEAPNRTGNFPLVHGVGCDGNYASEATNAPTSEAQTYPGIGSLIANGSPLYTDNKATSSGGAAGAGGGTYTLQAGSPARGIVTRKVRSFDLAGVAITAAGNGKYAAGAYN